jgi:hypothetical protein
MKGTVLVTERAAQMLSLENESLLGDWTVSVINPQDRDDVIAKADAAARQGRFIALVVFIPSVAGQNAEQASARGNQIRKAIADLQEAIMGAISRAKSGQGHVPVCGVVASVDPTAIPLAVGDVPRVMSADDLANWLRVLIPAAVPRSPETGVKILGKDDERTPARREPPAGPEADGEGEEERPRGPKARPAIRLAGGGEPKPKPARQDSGPSGPRLRLSLFRGPGTEDQREVRQREVRQVEERKPEVAVRMPPAGTARGAAENAERQAAGLMFLGALPPILIRAPLLVGERGVETKALSPFSHALEKSLKARFHIAEILGRPMVGLGSDSDAFVRLVTWMEIAATHPSGAILVAIVDDSSQMEAASFLSKIIDRSGVGIIYTGNSVGFFNYLANAGVGVLEKVGSNKAVERAVDAALTLLIRSYSEGSI